MSADSSRFVSNRRELRFRELRPQRVCCFVGRQNPCCSLGKFRLENRLDCVRKMLRLLKLHVLLLGNSSRVRVRSNQYHLNNFRPLYQNVRSDPAKPIVPAFFVPNQFASVKEIRLWKNGTFEAAPELGWRSAGVPVVGKSPVPGAKIAPCHLKFLPSFCSTRTCGRRDQRFPAAANCGIAAAASDVGLFGAKIIQSCPTVKEVRSQSNWALATRSLRTPIFSPTPTAGKSTVKIGFDNARNSGITDSSACNFHAKTSLSAACTDIALLPGVAQSGSSELFVPLLLPKALKKIIP